MAVLVGFTLLCAGLLVYQLRLSYRDNQSYGAGPDAGAQMAAMPGGLGESQ